MLHKRVFDLAFLCLLAQAEEVKAIGIFQRLNGQIGLRCRQTLFKVGNSVAPAFQQAGLDVDVQHVARPAMFNGGAGISQTLRWLFKPIQ